MGISVIGDGMDRIEAQPVDAVFLQPVEGVVKEEVAHDAAAFAVHVDACTPWCRMALREEGLGIGVQIIPRRAEMVVDHVEEDHQAKLVRALDETLEIIRAAIGGIGRVGQNAVIAPVSPAREFADRHELDRRDAEIAQELQPGRIRPA